MKTMPEIREEMYNIEVRLKELTTALTALREETYRSHTTPRRKRVSRPITSELRSVIFGFARNNPTMTQHQIAERFQINQGRVSEILNGFREDK